MKGVEPKMDDGLEQCILDIKNNIEGLEDAGAGEGNQALSQYKTLLMFLIELRWRRLQEEIVAKNLRPVGQ